MQFLPIIDELRGIQHILLISEIEPSEFLRIKKQCEEHIPHPSFSTVFRKGHPFITVEYGYGIYFKYAIPIDDLYASGEMLGDKLKVGDVITLIITDRPEDELIEIKNNELSISAPIEDLIAHSFTYTDEMNQMYEFYKLASSIKSKKFTFNKFSI